MAEIVLKDISKIYDIKTGTPAVDNVNLHIHDKEFLVLLGPSGCGKTSTLRMIAGLEEITSGEILFDGKKVNDLYPGERNIAMAFESYALYQHLTVWEKIAFPLKTRKLKKEVISERVRWTAEMLHITDILTKRPTELSGGQMQRVSLARAMVRNPNAFLFDEPLSHLDMKQRQHMRAELKRLNADLKTTMVYVTHDQREAMSLADRIAVMKNGEIQQVGTPMEIYTNPVNKFIAEFIGEPPMNFIHCHLKSNNDSVSVLLNNQSILSFSGNNFSSDVIDIGIRPRKLLFAREQKSPSYLPAEVLVYESIGERGILTVLLDDYQLRILTEPEQQYIKGERVWITFPYKDLYFFSQTTGERLREFEHKPLREKQ